MSDPICPTCKFTIVKDEYYPDGRCSDFCERTDAEQKEKFRNLKPGEWGDYPCSKCGVWIEDEYPEHNPYCGDCWPDVKLERTQKALQDVLSQYKSFGPLKLARATGLPMKRCKEILAISQGKFEEG